MRRIEYAHDDVPSIGDDEHRTEGLEDPFEEHPGIHIVQIVFVDDHLNELVAHDECEDQPCNGDDDVLGQGLDHGKDALVPEQRLSRGKMIYRNKKARLNRVQSGKQLKTI